MPGRMLDLSRSFSGRRADVLCWTGRPGRPRRPLFLVSHPLFDKLASLRRHLTWLRAGRALGWVAASIVLAGVGLAVLDYVFRYHDRGLRYLQTLALAAVVGAAIRRWIWPLRKATSEIRLAEAVSQRFDLPTDRLASALDFLGSGGRSQGESPALQRSVVHDAWAAVEPLDFRQAVDPRPCRRALIAGASAVTLLLLISLASPSLAFAGVARLLLPWSDRPWPQQHELEFRGLPAKIARGHALAAEVIDRRGALPPQVAVHLDYDSGESETLRLTSSGPAVRFQHDGPRESFWIWADGGDDRMPTPRRVEVVEPPAISQVGARLNPPEYLGLAPSTSERSLRAVAGTRVDLSGTADRPIASAAVALDDGTRIPLTVDPDRRSFRSSPRPEEQWLIAGSGAYHLELTDLDGVVGQEPEEWSIQALPDEPPEARLKVRGASTYATPEAELALEATAEDDWDLQDLGVEARAIAADGAAQVTSSPDRQWPAAPRTSEEIPPTEPSSGALSTVMRLADVPGAVPGATLSLAAVAHDRRPNEGRSAPLKLAIVTREEFLARFEAEMAKALADLRRIHALQETAQQRLAGATSPGAQRAAAGLAAAARDQGIVRRQLVDGPQSVFERAAGLSEVLGANGLADSEAGRRLEEVTETIASLETKLLPGLAADTVAVAREVSLDPASLRAPRLAEIQGRQQAVLDALGPLVGALQGWELLQQLAAQLAAVAEEERIMSAASAELAPATLGRAREELSVVEAGQLDHRTAEQRRLSRRFATLEQRLAGLSSELPASDAPLLERVEAALAQAASFAIGPRMQAAAADLEVNRPGRAAEAQLQAADHLDALVDTLRGVRPAADDAAIKSLAELQARQAELAAQMAAAANAQQLAALAQRQAALQKSLQAQANALSNAAAPAAAAASQAMSVAAQAARANQAKPAAEAAKKAAEQLQAAANSQQPPNANEDLAAKLRARALELRDAEQRLLDRTRSADATQALPLANDQAQLRGQVDGLSQASGKAPVVQYSLNQVSAAMARAVDLLERSDRGASTQQAQSEAIERLTQLADSLEQAAPKPDDPKQPPPQQPPGGQGQPGNPPPPGDPLLLAELKLVRQWQQTIQQRFASQAESADAETLKNLRDEQERLAKLAEEVAERAAAAAAPAMQNPGGNP